MPDMNTLLIAICVSLVIVLPLVAVMRLIKRRNPETYGKIDGVSVLIDLITRLFTGG